MARTFKLTERIQMGGPFPPIESKPFTLQELLQETDWSDEEIEKIITLRIGAAFTVDNGDFFVSRET